VLHDEFLAERFMLPSSCTPRSTPALPCRHPASTSQTQVSVTIQDVRVRLRRDATCRERQILPPCCVTGD
jgi:hypothetical protein